MPQTNGWNLLPAPDPYGPSAYDPAQDQQSAPVQPVTPPPKTEAEWLDPHNITDRLSSDYQGEPLHQDPNLKAAVSKKIIYDGWKDRFVGKSPEAKLQVLDAMVDDMHLETSYEKDAAKRYAWATIKDNIGRSVQDRAEALKSEIEATRKQKVLTQMQLQNIRDMEQAGYDVKPANERMKQDELVQEKRKAELETKKTAIAEKQAQLRGMVEDASFTMDIRRKALKDALADSAEAPKDPVSKKAVRDAQAQYEAAKYEHDKALRNFSSFKPYMGNEPTREAGPAAPAAAPGAVTLTSPDGTKKKIFTDPAMIQKAQSMGWK